jgi:hypothetical protein
VHQRFLTLISIYLYIYFFLVAQKSFSHHAGARKERLFVRCWTSIFSRVLAAFCFLLFCVNDRLNFRAIIMMDIFNKFDRLFSISLFYSLSRCARKCAHRFFRKRIIVDLLADAVFFFSFSLILLYSVLINNRLFNNRLF